VVLLPPICGTGSAGGADYGLDPDLGSDPDPLSDDVVGRLDALNENLKTSWTGKAREDDE